MSTTLSTLRQKLGLVMRTYRATGACTSGTTLTVVDSSRDEEDDYWNKGWVTVKDVSNTVTETKETREISDFTTAAGTMTVLQAFSFTVAASDTYEIHKKFSVDELNEAINEAIRRTRDKIFSKTYATDTTVASTYSYAMASTTGEVYAVELQADSSISTYPYYHLLKWRPLWSGSTQTIQLDTAVDTGYTLRFHYLSPKDELTSDTSTTDIATDYLYAAARAYLYATLMDDCKTDEEYRRYMSSRDEWSREAARLLRGYTMQPPAGRIYKGDAWLGGESWYDVTYEKESLS